MTTPTPQGMLIQLTFTVDNISRNDAAKDGDLDSFFKRYDKTIQVSEDELPIVV